VDQLPLHYQFLILLLLIVLAAFFSSTETALMSVNRYRLRHLAREGSRGARAAEQLLEQPDRLIGLILICNNFVNLAAASLLATEFVAAVSVQLQAAPGAAAKLWVDLPESLAVSHPGVIQELTRRWRALGVHVGLEHAGAALSGMTRLYELGLDYVRIDARFLAGIGADADVRRHAEGLVTLLRGIGLGIYAEGVSRSEDLQVLWHLGFDGATGPAVTQP